MSEHYSFLDHIADRRAGHAGWMKVEGFWAEIHTRMGYLDVVRSIELTSAGVWILFVDKAQKNIYLLLTEQADKPLDSYGQLPWEIPSGGADPTKDKDIFATIKREVLEETGLCLDAEGLEPLTLAQRGELALSERHPQYRDSGQNDFLISTSRLLENSAEKAGIIFVIVINILEIASWKRLPTIDSSIILEPPIDVDRGEISRLALVPIEMVLNKTSFLFNSSLHPWANLSALAAMREKFSQLVR